MSDDINRVLLPHSTLHKIFRVVDNLQYADESVS